MIDFEAFERYLLNVIEETAHSNETLTNEERFDNAMRALFGKNYEVCLPKDPFEFDHADIQKLLEVKASKGSLEKAIKALVEEKHGHLQKNETQLLAIRERVKKHIQRYEAVHLWVNALS